MIDCIAYAYVCFSVSIQQHGVDTSVKYVSHNCKLYQYILGFLVHLSHSAKHTCEHQGLLGNFQMKVAAFWQGVTDCGFLF